MLEADRREHLGRRREARIDAASHRMVPSMYSGRTVSHAQGSAPGKVARWRQIRFTTLTP
jgi:hypothetical protein